jgi:prevent-host-death family protein
LLRAELNSGVVFVTLAKFDGPCSKIMAKLAISAYNRSMKTVNIGDLKNQLSAYLQIVRNGEEVVVRDRNLPVARILPIDYAAIPDLERQLVASGAMKLPEREMNWDLFWSMPRAGVSRQAALDAALAARGDR